MKIFASEVIAIVVLQSVVLSLDFIWRPLGVIPNTLPFFAFYVGFRHKSQWLRTSASVFVLAYANSLILHYPLVMASAVGLLVALFGMAYGRRLVIRDRRISFVLAALISVFFEGALLFGGHLLFFNSNAQFMAWLFIVFAVTGGCLGVIAFGLLKQINAMFSTTAHEQLAILEGM